MPNASLSPYSFINLLNDLLVGPITAASATTVTYTVNALRVNVDGTSLAVGQHGSETELTGGTVKAFRIEVFQQTGPDTFDWVAIGGASGFSLAAAAMNQAINAEQADTDVAAIERLFGGFNYTFTGGSGNDVVQPTQSSDDLQIDLRGNDSLTGGSGDDSLGGGSGADTITSGDGHDTIYGGDGDDVIHGEGVSPNKLLDGGNGDDVIFSGGNSCTVFGGEGDDTLRGYSTSSQEFQTLHGGEGNDVYIAYAGYGKAAFYGEEGGDRGSGGIDGDTMDGGSGDDTLDGAGGLDSLAGGDDEDSIHGGDSNDTLDGGAGADTLFGDDGDDSIAGLSENDSIDGGDGADSIDGGSGDDIIRGGQGSSSFQGDSLYGGSGADRISGQAGADSIYGGTGNDSADGGDGADYLSGNGGNDTLRGGDVSSVASGDVLYGDGGNDQIFGELGDDYLDGGSGADTLDGGVGADTMDGGDGDDTYFVDDTGDTIDENPGEGALDIVAARASYALAAGVSVEDIRTSSASGTTAINLTGNELDQTLRGNAGANQINGKAGADTMVGGGGNDLFFVDNSGDTVVETSTGGANDAVATNLSFTLETGCYVETLRTTSNAGTAAINLAGNEFANTIVGNAGANTINGRGGNDTLTGLGGADAFVFDRALGSSNVDHVTDFAHGTDKVRLDHTIFTTLPVGALASSAFKDISAAAEDSNDRVLYKHATGALYYDADGAGGNAAVLFAVLDNKPATITSSDFLIVA